jgi:hypothetical protein
MRITKPFINRLIGIYYKVFEVICRNTRIIENGIDYTFVVDYKSIKPEIEPFIIAAIKDL